MFKRKVIGSMLMLTLSLFANEKEHLQALDYQAQKQYDKAFDIFLKEAKEGHRASSYRVADMYENGLGVEQNNDKSLYWYKQASSQYKYVVKQQEDNSTSFWSHLEDQFGGENFDLGTEYIVRKLDTQSPEVSKAIKSLEKSSFYGLQAYQANYILPISAGKANPPYHFSAFSLQYIEALRLDARYEKKVEVEFQVSMKKMLTYDLFGWNELIYGAFTQKVWWQLYTDSAPFRETNYLPEIFMKIPTSKSVDDKIGLKFIKTGFLHESNGQDGFRSRSWNRIYITGQWQWDNLFLNTRAWYKLPEEKKTDAYYNGTSSNPAELGDDNPDIHEYLGYGDIKVDYLYGGHQFGLLVRNNLKFDGGNKGAVELTWMYSVLQSDNTALYIKLFHGYAESLITYDIETSKAAIGITLTRGLFQ